VQFWSRGGDFKGLGGRLNYDTCTLFSQLAENGGLVTAFGFIRSFHDLDVDDHGLVRPPEAIARTELRLLAVRRKSSNYIPKSHQNWCCHPIREYAKRPLSRQCHRASRLCAFIAARTADAARTRAISSPASPAKRSAPAWEIQTCRICEFAEFAAQDIESARAPIDITPRVLHVCITSLRTQ
jgi:hypothetical protein